PYATILPSMREPKLRLSSDTEEFWSTPSEYELNSRFLYRSASKRPWRKLHALQRAKSAIRARRVRTKRRKAKASKEKAHKNNQRTSSLLRKVFSRLRTNRHRLLHPRCEIHLTPCSPFTTTDERLLPPHRLAPAALGDLRHQSRTPVLAALLQLAKGLQL